MRTKLKHSILISILFLFSLILLPGYRAEAASVKVKLNKTSATLYMDGTKTVKLKATVTGSNKKVAWSSSNKKVATVNASGKVTAKKAGTATITAKVAGKTAKCKITVKEVSVTIKLDKTSLTLDAGKTAKLKATVTGSSAKVTWSSSDKKVATVNASGKVTAKKAGTATVTAKVAGKAAKCEVTVKKKASDGTPGTAEASTVYWYKSVGHLDGKTRYDFIADIPMENSSVFSYPNISGINVTGLKSINNDNISVWWDYFEYLENYSGSPLTIDGSIDTAPKSTETGTLRFTMEGDGKTYEMSTKLTLKQLPDNIIKSLKIGSEEFAPYFKGSVAECYLPEKFKKVVGRKKISVKLASGCKLESMYMNIGWPTADGLMPVKNGSVVSTESMWALTLLCRNKGALCVYTLNFNIVYY